MIVNQGKAVKTKYEAQVAIADLNAFLEKFAEFTEENVNEGLVVGCVGFNGIYTVVSMSPHTAEKCFAVRSRSYLLVCTEDMSSIQNNVHKVLEAHTSKKSLVNLLNKDGWYRV